MNVRGLGVKRAIRILSIAEMMAKVTVLPRERRTQVMVGNLPREVGSNPATYRD